MSWYVGKKTRKQEESFEEDDDQARGCGGAFAALPGETKAPQAKRRRASFTT